MAIFSSYLHIYLKYKRFILTFTTTYNHKITYHLHERFNLVSVTRLADSPQKAVISKRSLRSQHLDE